MSAKHTWFWFVLAAGLFGLVLLHERHKQGLVSGPIKVLPGLKPAEVTSIQIRPRDQLEIRVDRTNGGWQLTKPLPFPASGQVGAIENFLTVMQRLAPAVIIDASELKQHPRAEEEYGLGSPASSIVIQQADANFHLLVGSRTAPGDQVFLQVVSVEGVYVSDADVLKVIPRSPDEWRDTTFISLKGIALDHVAVTNGAASFELQRVPAAKQWRMIWPPPATRANNDKVELSLESIERLRIGHFVSDDPKPDLETSGLQSPELEVLLGQGSNTIAWLQFGKNATNDPRQVYARRVGQNGIVTVSKEALAPWRSAVNNFRDPRLVSLNDPVEAIEIFGTDHFSVVRQTNEEWRVLPQNIVAEQVVVKEMLGDLSSMEAQFVKAVVTEPDLPGYGLASPSLRYILKNSAADPLILTTNGIIADVSFGTNQEDRVFARRADESFVYSVKPAEFSRLPASSWQFRNRQVWNFSDDDVARVTIRQQGKVRQIIRNGPHNWSFAPGSQGILDDLAVEATVGGLVRLRAAIWVAHGEQKRPQYGFKADGHQITIELKNGEKATIEFGGQSPVTSFPYAAVRLEDKEVWIFEFPWPLYRDVQGCLSIPPGP